MKKRVLSIILAAAMAGTLAACGSSSGSSTDTTSATASEAAEGTDAAEGEAAAPSDYFETTQHLVVAFPTWTGAPKDLDMVTEEINKILLEKHNIEIEMQIGDSGSYSQNLTLELAGGQQLDVISTLFAGYSNLVNQGYLMDLEQDDLLATYGDGIVDALGQEFVDMCRVGGVLYGLTNTRDYAAGRGCIAVGTEYLEGIGYEFPDTDEEILQITDEELEDIFARLHETYPNLEVYRPANNDLVQQTVIDQIGGTNFGVLTNYGQELKVEDLFTSDEYRTFCERVYSWNQKGYISKDAATDTTSVGQLVKDGVLMAYGTGGKPGSKAQESLGDGRDMTIFQVKEDFMAGSSVASYPWAIPITTVNPQAAMVLMKALYTDPDIANLFVYGIEGTHYELDEDGLIDATKGSGSGNYGTLPWLYPNQFLTTPTTGNSADLWDRIKEFNTNAKKSAAAGFAFDSTPVATQLAACTNIYNEYQKQLEYGFLNPEAGLKELDDKMMAAGLQDIIDEKQSQLDAWAAAK